jgi:hypothetical protein
MSATVHAAAGSVALLFVALIWLSTAVSELFLSTYAVVAVKRGILYAIPILITSLAVPSAFLLQAKAAEGRFDTAFVVVQAIELVAGAVQMTLLARNFRDGLRLSGRLRSHSVRAAG